MLQRYTLLFCTLIVILCVELNHSKSHDSEDAGSDQIKQVLEYG